MTDDANQRARDLETADEILSLLDVDPAANPKRYAIQREEVADYLAAGREQGRQQEWAALVAFMHRRSGA